MRFRNAYVVGGTGLVMLGWILTDPDLGIIQDMGFGAGVVTMVLFLLLGVISSALLYITRKAMMDYDAADFRILGEKASRSPEGAGMYAIAVAIMTLAFAVVIVGGFTVMK
jgi:uncharacterized membrane protein (Fun14 family)